MHDWGIDLDEVRDFLARKEARRSQALDRMFAQATEDAARIVAAVSSQFEVARIWQWGSLLDRSRFSEISDIDIALEGVKRPEDFFGILGAAERLTRFPIDIIELEGIRPETAERIRRKGRLVYEQRAS